MAPYLYENENCWAVTLTTIESDGASLTSGSLWNVYPARPIRISTGTIVQPHSSLLEPCTCGGSIWRPGRARKRIAE